MRQQQTWGSGDDVVIASLVVPVSERLCEAIGLRAGERVLEEVAWVETRATRPLMASPPPPPSLPHSGNRPATLTAMERVADKALETRRLTLSGCAPNWQCGSAAPTRWWVIEIPRRGLFVMGLPFSSQVERGAA